MTVLDDDFSDDSGNLTDIENSYTFTGRWYDLELGVFNYRHRNCTSTTGRFVTRDPIGYDGSQYNLYEYANSDPVNKTDPLGLKFFPINSVICNKSSKCVVVWSSDTGFSPLYPGKCTNFFFDHGDFVYYNGDWYKDGDGGSDLHVVDDENGGLDIGVWISDLGSEQVGCMRFEPVNPETGWTPFQADPPDCLQCLCDVQHSPSASLNIPPEDLWRVLPISPFPFY